MWLSNVMRCAAGFLARSNGTDRRQAARSRAEEVTRQTETTSRQREWRLLGGLLGTLLLGLAGAPSASAGTTTLTFDDLPEGTYLTTQYQGVGVTAEGVTVYNALNLPWPANTPPNVVLSDTGFINFYFDQGITGNIQKVSAYIAGTSSIGLYVYDASGTLVGQASTTGATETFVFVSVTSSGNPIARVTIHDGGSNFAIDTLTLNSPTNYTVVTLGLGGTSGGVLPHGINGSGQVAGYAATPSGANHAFFYSGTTLSDLGTLGGRNSVASAVNQSGQAVGTTDLNRKDSRAFSWTPGGGMVDLGTLGGKSSSASAINANGQVVGTAQTSNGQVHAALWYQGGVSDLGTLGGASSNASDINGVGQVVGSALTRKQLTHAFVGTTSGGLTDLGTLGGKSSSANAINANGQVIGTAQTSNGQNHAFIWSTANGMVDLGTLGGAGSTTSAVNDNGQAIGSAQLPSGKSHAFSWTSAGGLVDLGTLGGTESAANAVNAGGQVVGSAQDANGQWRAFVWTSTEGMVDLNSRLINPPSNMKLLSALAISDNGTIAVLSDTGVVLLKPQ